MQRNEKKYIGWILENTVPQQQQVKVNSNSNTQALCKSFSLKNLQLKNSIKKLNEKNKKAQERDNRFEERSTLEQK